MSHLAQVGGQFTRAEGREVFQDVKAEDDIRCFAQCRFPAAQSARPHPTTEDFARKANQRPILSMSPVTALPSSCRTLAIAEGEDPSLSPPAEDTGRSSSIASLLGLRFQTTPLKRNPSV